MVPTALSAALLSCFSYQLLFQSSALLMPKLWAGYRRLSPQDQVDWNTRLPSTLHALVVSALSIWALCYSPVFLAAPAAGAGLPHLALRSSPLSYAVAGISGGYFAVDAALLLAHPEIATREMLVHHAVALASLAVAAQVGVAHVYLLVVLLSELTTPFANARWLLDKAGLKAGRLYTVNGLLLLAVWGIARVGLFVPFYAHVLGNWQVVSQIPPHAALLLLGVPLLLFLLNAVWFGKIVRGAVKLVRGGGEAGAEVGAGAARGGGKQGPAAAGRIDVAAYAHHRQAD